MRKVIVRVLVAAAIGFVCLGGRSASALTAYHSPWGDQNTHTLIGSDSTGAQYIIWILRPHVSGVEFTMIGDANGLWDDTEVHGGPGSDGIQLLSDGFTTGFGTYNSIRYAGHYLDIYGGPGVDSLYGFIGDTWCFGEGGDDDVYSLNPTGLLSGGPGNDTVDYFRLIGTGQVVHGDGGDDCMEDTSLTPAGFSCGPGNDSTTIRGTPPNADSCEQQVQTCPTRWSEVCPVVDPWC